METFFGKLKSTSEDFVIVETGTKIQVMPRFKSDNLNAKVFNRTIPSEAFDIATTSENKTSEWNGSYVVDNDFLFLGKGFWK